MVLQKRKADGSFEDWSSKHTPTASTNTYKKARTATDETSTSNPASKARTATSRPTSNSLSSAPGTRFTDPTEGYMASSYPFSQSYLAPQSLPSATPNFPLSSSTTSYAGISSQPQTISTVASSGSNATVSSSSKGGMASPSVAGAGSSPSPKKGKGKGKDKEKRKAQFKPKCPMAIQTRLERYMSQSSRIYLIDRQREEGENKEKFTVQGSTGNVYTVTIDEVPHCNCPDHLKGNHCKHILFIFVKVLQVSLTSGLWYQKALLPSELASIFSSAPLPPQLRQQLQNIHANERVVGAWREKTGRGPVQATSG
ncbi:hypothetical protein K435DRAFT_813189, partial [Dendrothele bispora CBS 962.96]